MLQEIIPAETNSISLESLLAESLQAKKLADKEKEMRKRLNSGKLGADEAIETVALLRKWDNQREWKRTSNILGFTRQLCKACGTLHNTFEGYFEGFTSNRLANTHKMESVKFFELDLPKKVKYHDSVVPVCHSCADSFDWELEED